MIGLVLLAAGNSERFLKSLYEQKSDLPKELIKSIEKQSIFNKIFIEINNKYLWKYSLDKFIEFNKNHKKITDVIFVLNPQTIDYHQKIIMENIEDSNFKSIDFVEGGEKRQDSVFNGIKKLENKYLEYIIIHDLARPYITLEDIKNLINEIKDFDGVTLYSLPNDSVAANYDNKVTYLPRKQIYLIKTPQIFRKEALLNAHQEMRNENLNLEFTDDISLLDFYLYKTTFIPGNPLNIKLTTIHDYFILYSILTNNLCLRTTWNL